MRLGMNWVELRTREDFESHVDEIDRLGLGAISAPSAIAGWSIDECAAYGDLAEEFGLVVVETFQAGNLLHPDPEVRARNIATIRNTLVRADAMRVDTVTSLAGSFAAGDFLEGAIRPHPDNWSDAARAIMRENCERILDGLDLVFTTYSIEPMPSSFFHEPEGIRALIDEVGHSRLRVHLDMMNMHSMATYFRSGELIERAFDLLGDVVAAVHAKDLLWSDRDIFVRLEEVPPGDGVLDYPLFVRRLGDLPADLGVLTEHWATAEEYRRGIAFIRELAAGQGITPVGRGPRRA